MGYESDLEYTNLQETGSIVHDHNAHCMACKRVIRAPISIARRLGPVCYKKLVGNSKEAATWK